ATIPRQPLCADSGQGTAGCRLLPISLSLVPGPKEPDNTVEVRIDAVHLGTPVIRQAASFTFVRGQRLELDFYLYAACLGVDCPVEERARACGADGMCFELDPPPLGHPPDLSGSADGGGADGSVGDSGSAGDGG